MVFEHQSSKQQQPPATMSSPYYDSENTVYVDSLSVSLKGATGSFPLSLSVGNARLCSR